MLESVAAASDASCYVVVCVDIVSIVFAIAAFVVVVIESCLLIGCLQLALSFLRIYE
jgi:hypothetical protein